jgi:hypothetical protein
VGAANLQTLYQFEKAFEDAAVTFLESEVGIDVYPSASLEDLITPRLDIEFTTGEATLPIDAPIISSPPLTLGEYRKHDADFTVRVVTDPTAGQTRADHFSYVGLTRVALLRSSTNWDATSLPFYDLKFIRQTGTSRMTDQDFQVTIISWEVKFSIRDDAFPTTTTTTAAP